jgi:hypothetical protein
MAKSICAMAFFILSAILRDAPKHKGIFAMTMIETSHQGGSFFEQPRSHTTRFTAALSGAQEAVRTTVDFSPDFEIPEPTFVPLQREVDTTPRAYDVHLRVETEDHILGRE